jgi:hypothetical protein
MQSPEDDNDLPALLMGPYRECKRLLNLPCNGAAQTTDVMHPDNHTVFTCNRYPPVDALRVREGTNRITAHTDESLMTLLLASPGAPPA